jgi:hypothetical protein
LDGRAPEKAPMTDLTDTNRPGIRFTKDFGFFDHARTHMWRSWSAGDVVDDPRDIDWLVGIGAPVQEEIYRR